MPYKDDDRQEQEDRILLQKDVPKLEHVAHVTMLHCTASFSGACLITALHDIYSGQVGATCKGLRELVEFTALRYPHADSKPYSSCYFFREKTRKREENWS